MSPNYCAIRIMNTLSCLTKNECHFSIAISLLAASHIINKWVLLLNLETILFLTENCNLNFPLKTTQRPLIKVVQGICCWHMNVIDDIKEIFSHPENVCIDFTLFRWRQVQSSLKNNMEIFTFTSLHIINDNLYSP